MLREDLNVTQLGLISIQRKIADDYTSWKVAFERAGIESEVECNGAQKYGVPHGIDNDSYLALQELYIEQGCAEDGRVAFTMYRLLQLCGLEDSCANRRMMRESLERLSATQYWISGAWRSHENDDWVTVGFRLIEKLAFTRSRRDSGGAQAIAVSLPAELTRNIRNGYFKPVSTTLMRQLGQPARAAYRVIDSLRHDPVQHHLKTGTLQLPLMDLAQRCGIAAARQDPADPGADSHHAAGVWVPARRADHRAWEGPDRELHLWLDGAGTQRRAGGAADGAESAAGGCQEGRARLPGKGP
ncbi:replication initiator protein A [Deinococcus marmoris]|uniref:replication initiator protein A n=1 Tax=Deinococcus marmoris TaxID=249408 RepID=UPI0020C991CF|nr:replication initiator protein A [Deinococcus marmoris]